MVGWGVLIAVLIGLIIWGIIQLAQGSPSFVADDHYHAHHGHRHDVGLADFERRHRHADEHLAVARGVPAPALGDHAAVAAGASTEITLPPGL